VTDTLRPQFTPPPPPEVIEPFEREEATPPDVAAYRRSLRRRLLLVSLPVVALVVLVAIKLLSMPLLAAVSQATYGATSYESSVTAADGLGVANVVERWVQHFDRGAALGQIGLLEESRSELERALALVPTSDATSSCRVRTDLVLVVEQQGDSAVLDQQFARAVAFYTQSLALIQGAPGGCFRSPDPAATPDSKKPLDDAQSRLQQKQKQAEQQAGGTSGTPNQQGAPGGQKPGGSNGQGQGSQGGQNPAPHGQGGTGQSPLDKLKQKDGQAQKQQQQQNDRNRSFGQNPNDYSGKPW
jgi:hypothetical protein